MNLPLKVKHPTAPLAPLALRFSSPTLKPLQMVGYNDGPAAATRARAALSDISNAKGSARGVPGKVCTRDACASAPRLPACTCACPVRTVVA